MWHPSVSALTGYRAGRFPAWEQPPGNLHTTKLFHSYTLENGTIRVDLDKVAAVQTWPAPTCVKEVQQFLGLANYYHEFIKNFAKLAAPLSDL